MFYSTVLSINVLLIPKCKVSLIAFSCRGLRLNLVVLLCHLAYQCLRGSLAQKKNLYLWVDSHENLHTYIKSKIKWGNC